MWFGTIGGASRYDGRTFVNFTAQDGLPFLSEVYAIHRDPDGVMWFGTWGGLSRYDGKTFVNFTTKDGLAYNRVNAIYRDPDGVLWFATHAGVSRYDGNRFVNFTKEFKREDDWGFNRVLAIYRDSDGVLWFGTEMGGVSRYDGKTFVQFTVEDGLAYNWVTSIHRDEDGRMWFATFGGGVSQYDGVTWASLDTRDGLASNNVSSIYQDSEGTFWFGTDKGVTHYRRNPVPPKVRIVAVTTDQRYTDLNALGPVIAGTRITFEYSAIDFKTHPQKRQYRYRIKSLAKREPALSGEIDPDWRSPIKATAFEWIPEKSGSYTFEVQAIDRDLNYSLPASLSFHVQPDPREATIAALQTTVDRLRQEVGRKYHFPNIVGRSALIKQVHALMERAIDSGLAVLISGETGTGKELVAKAIHYNSLRKNRPLMELNCGAVPKDLIASTLFGHRKGAFTGASEDTAGLFESAAGGTVLLDEIGEMPNEAQVSFLRVLQERKIQRLGETRLRDVDVRIIAVTNRDLQADVEARRFRDDLYYRLNVFPIHLPPLRARLEDIPLLATHLLAQACQQLGKKIDGFAPGVTEMFQSYPWPGNVRELENEINRAVALAEDGIKLQTYHFSSKIAGEESLIQDILSKPLSYAESVERFRRRLVENALRECGGNRHEAARRLGMRRSNLLELIKRLRIE